MKKEDPISQLTIGQTVVHPNHGIGTITNVTKLDLLENFNRYYVIDFFTHNLTSRIPIRKISDIGLRKTMSQEKVSQVFQTLRDMPEGLPDHYKQRKRQIEALIHSGNPVKVATAVRELTWRKSIDKLSTSDNQMLAKGREMLIEEIALVTDSDDTETRHKVDLALEKAIEAGQGLKN